MTYYVQNSDGNESVWHLCFNDIAVSYGMCFSIMEFVCLKRRFLLLFSKKTTVQININDIYIVYLHKYEYVFMKDMQHCFFFNNIYE